jgi:hypothetical protein
MAASSTADSWSGAFKRGLDLAASHMAIQRIWCDHRLIAPLVSASLVFRSIIPILVYPSQVMSCDVSPVYCIVLRYPRPLLKCSGQVIFADTAVSVFIMGGSMDADRASAEKTCEAETGKAETAKKKKPYNTPSLRFLTSAEISALSCDKSSSTQNGSSLNRKPPG